MPRLALRRTCGAALAIAALGAAATAQADQPAAPAAKPHGKIIRLTEASPTLQPAFADTGAPGPSPGDLAVLHDGVLREDGSPAGSFNQVCTLAELKGGPFTSGFECTGSLTLGGDTITMAGPFTPAATEQTAAITGGTGRFRTARGEIVLRAEDDQLVVVLAG
jgi:allene oxide cyclase